MANLQQLPSILERLLRDQQKGPAVLDLSNVAWIFAFFSLITWLFVFIIQTMPVVCLLSTLTANQCPESALFDRCCCGYPQIYILLSPSDDTTSQGLCNPSLRANDPALHPCPEVHIFGSFYRSVYRKVSKTENLSRRTPPNIDISIHSENELHVLHFSTSSILHMYYTSCSITHHLYPMIYLFSALLEYFDVA